MLFVKTNTIVQINNVYLDTYDNFKSDYSLIPESWDLYTEIVLSQDKFLGVFPNGETYSSLPSANELNVFNHISQILENKLVRSTKSLDELKSKIADEIDKKAGDIRLKYITSVPGQAETYMMKLEQAREYKANGYTGDLPPFILAEVNSSRVHPIKAADSIISTYEMWKIKAVQIEEARRIGKNDVYASLTSDSVFSSRDKAFKRLEAL